MTFGVLTDKEKLVRQERTALFINLAGVTAQNSLSAHEQGISTRKFYKILANVIYDWHWLAHKNNEAFRFSGIGDLVWIPHRFGALGQVKSVLEYEGESIAIHHSQFANLVDLFQSKIYSSYGYRGTTKVSDQRYLRFPTYINYKDLTKSRVEPQERHFWEELVKIYAPLSDASLDALASCRTKTAGTHSLWIQFIMWKRFIGISLDMLNTQNPLSYDAGTRKKLMENIDNARACIRQLFLKIKYQHEIESYINMVRQNAAHTELSSYIPCLDEMESSIASKHEIFIELSSSLETLHDLFREFQIHLGLDQQQRDASVRIIQSKLQLIGESLAIPSTLINPTEWCNLFLQKDKRKEIAQHIMRLIEYSYKTFETKLDLEFERPSGYYGKFLANHYPLPTEFFVQGN